MDCSIGFLFPAIFSFPPVSFFPPIFSSCWFPSFRPRRGRTFNNRWWNDHRSCNLRISWYSLSIVPEGGEPHPLFLLFAPFGDVSVWCSAIRRFHSLRSFHQRLLKVGPLRGPEVMRPGGFAIPQDGNPARRPGGFAIRR